MAIIHRLPLFVIAGWVVSVLLCNFLIVIKPFSVRFEPSDEESFELVNAFVFLAFGELAKGNLADYSIATMRKVGKWRGKAFVITDIPDCFAETAKKYDVHVIKAPKLKDVIEIKSMKTKLFDYLPADVTSVLYLDADVLVTQSLRGFLRDLASQTPFEARGRTNSSSSSLAVTPTSPTFDAGLFLDAGGHFVGFCSGCEKWHTGVLWLRRGHGTKCMNAWDTILRSGKYNTDQQSLDEAESSGSCSKLIAFPEKHLLFGKDYIAMIFRTGHTFTHLTATARLNTQDYFYSNLVVPLIRSSLRPEVDRAIIDKQKECAL
jgi:hypothetical protein